MQQVTSFFTAIGGQFISPPEHICKRLEGIKAFIFDWDGVFNTGEKMESGSSTFNEVDSMGTNLLRYAYFLNHQKLPITAVISGERNESAFYFCNRECFNYSFSKTPHKTDALKFICEKEKLEPHEVAYFFDDVLDLSIAEICGIRVLVNRKASPLFTGYCVRNNYADYITASQGGNYAVREACDLLTGLYGDYNRVINSRTHYSEDYRTYITQRRLVKTQFFTVKENVVEEIKTDPA